VVRRTIGWLVATGVVLIGVASACGVPSSGQPVADRAISADRAGGGLGDVVTPPGPGDEAARTPTGLVDTYLSATAAATNADDQLAAARAFMLPRVASDWKPNGPVTVVRRIGDYTDNITAPATDEITGTFQIVGLFSVDSGELGPPQSSQTQIKLTFETGTNPDDAKNADIRSPGTLRLTEVPPTMFMSEQAFQAWFRPHPIYFWDNSKSALIPDQRYLSTVLSPTVQATKIVNWVLAGPSDLIQGATGSIVPAGTSLVDPTVTVDKNTFVVNLSPSAHALANPSPLAFQLRWSLGVLLANPSGGVVPSPVEIEIDGQRQVVSSGNDYRERVDNLAPSGATGQAATFAIANGKVVEISADTSAKVTTELATRDQARVLNSPRNSDVVLGAVNNSESAAAIVRVDASGTQSLWIRRTEGHPTSEFTLVKGLPSGTMSRPQFVVQPHDGVVVAVDGQPYLVDQSDHVHEIGLPSGIDGLTSFSVAADGHRIAFVSGGNLYLSVIPNSNAPTMTPPRLVQLGYLNEEASIHTVTAVAWSSVDQLIVAGTDKSRAEVAEIFIDGSLEPTPYTQDYGALTISQVLAHSYNGLQDSFFDDVMLQTNHGAFAGRYVRLPLQLGPANKATPLSAPFFQD